MSILQPPLERQGQEVRVSCLSACLLFIPLHAGPSPRKSSDSIVVCDAPTRNVVETSPVSMCRDMEMKIGQVSCSKCGANFECKITPLHEAIDIYSEWIDACEQVREDDA